jgi:hypothetical protein
MTYTKLIARSDKIIIGSTDVSNSFRQFGYSSENAKEDVTGFSAAGTAETLPGVTTQSFSGEAFYAEELVAIIEPLHRARTPVYISWQPNGLADATREIYSGTCTIDTFGPANTVGSVSTMPFAAAPSTSAGIVVSDFT